MGCLNAKTSTNTKNEPFQSLGSTSEMQSLQVSSEDLVNEKKGNITQYYTLLSPPLGSGAFGEVRRAIHKNTGMVRAVKIISKSQTTEDEVEKLINEVNILKKLDHPHIIKIYEFFQDQKCFYIVTDLCTGGELFDKIVEKGCFDEQTSAIIMKQILSAVAYCHSHNVVHRDLKPENLLYESAKPNALIKVIDFGTSKVFTPNEKLTQKFGTPYYVAPEVLKMKYGEKCDVWSCGVILYVLLCGYPPFNGPSDKAIMEKVLGGVYKFDGEEWEHVSTDAKNLVKRLLEYDPAKRPSATEVLNDPWVQSSTNKKEINSEVSAKVLKNLRSFRADCNLQQATWTFLVQQLATKEEKNELLTIFQQLDTNGDGQLSREELIAGFEKTMGRAQAEAEVDHIMKTLDTNNSGSIDYSEFIVATINKTKLLSKQRLEAAFKMFDQDGSGAISIDELREVFGNKIGEASWKQMIKEFDINGDGQISLDEFKTMMQKLMDK